MPLTPPRSIEPNGTINQLLANDGSGGLANVNVGTGLDYDILSQSLSATGAVGDVISFNGRQGIVVPIAGDYTASQITNIPAGSISATNVQDAINELDTTISAPNVYSQTFNATTDWGAASGGLYTITITAATHGFGLNISDIVVYEISGSDDIQTIPNQVILDNVTGDVSFNVSEIPDGRFAGKVVIIKGIAGGAGSGITSLNGLVDEVQLLATGTTGTDFNIDSTGDTHTFNLPDANIGTRGILSLGYQNIDGAKTFVNSTNGFAKGAGLYNPDVTDDNGLTFNYEVDTTGAGAQTQFGASFIFFNTKDHNHSTLTVNWGINTYRNGSTETILSYDELGIMSTQAQQFTIDGVAGGGLTVNNGDIRANNGFIIGGSTLDVLTGQGFNQGMNNVGGQINVPTGGAITGTNIFGTNLAQGFLWSEDIDGGTVPAIGLTAVGYVGYLLGQVAGKTIETINMNVAGVSDGGSIAGSAVTNLNMYTAAGLAWGSMGVTIDNSRLFYAPSSTYSSYAIKQWGVCIDQPIDNYFDKSITVGGGAGSVTTNPDISIEVKSKKPIKLPSLTTTEINAIASPENPMFVHDSTLNKLCWYNGTTWETITSI